MGDDEVYLECACPECTGAIEFPSSRCGEWVECPHCGTRMELAASSDEPAPVPAPALTCQDIGAGIRGNVGRRKASWRYRIALLAVSAAMVVLPMLYLGVVFLTGWGFFVFAWKGFPWLDRFTGGSSLPVIAAVLFVMGLFIGAFLLTFLLKPLFTSGRTRAQPLALHPGAEPLLYTFVQRLCDTLGTSCPDRIDADCRLNASTRFLRGVSGWIRGRLVLTLGLPLVASLSLRQFAGVLAHELGHLNQHAGLRASYVIRAMNAWFTRVACEPDTWDQTIHAWAMAAPNLRTHLIASIARFGAFLSRGLFSVMMYAGRAVSSMLLREMELDADHCQIEVAGAVEFENTFRRIRVLSRVSRDQYRELRASWDRDRHLPDNLPRCIAHAEAAFGEKLRERLQRHQDRQETDIFDTHPDDFTRIRRAQETGAPGVVDLEGPATVLFSNFDALARQVTLLHYEEDLGLPREAIRLVPTATT